MRLLLIANMENYGEYALAAIKKTLENAKTVLFLSYAKPDDNTEFFQVKTLLEALDKQVISANSGDPLALFAKADAVFIGRGNVFRLLKTLNDNQLKFAIAKRINQGMPCISCGTSIHIFSPSIQTTSDMPIASVNNLKGIGALPFQIYLFNKKFTMQDLKKIREFHEINSIPVLCLSTDSVLKYLRGHLYLEGVACAALLRKGFRPLTLDAGKLETIHFFQSPPAIGDFFHPPTKVWPNNDEYYATNRRASPTHSPI